MSAKRNLFLGLLIGAALGGAFPAFLSFHGWTSAQDSRTVLLRQGWNQLVWTADNQPADTALAAIAGDLVMAYGWQGESQTFTRYITGRGDVSTMSMLQRDSGYWLLLNRDVFFTMPARFSECPTPTSCPATANPTADECAATKMAIEVLRIHLDMAEKRGMIGSTPGEIQAWIAATEQDFNASCQGVPLAQPSMLTKGCAEVGRWKGAEERETLYNPTPQGMMWYTQLVGLIDQYCNP